MFHIAATNNVHRACSNMLHAAARDDVRRRSSNISRTAAFKNIRRISSNMCHTAASENVSRSTQQHVSRNSHVGLAATCITQQIRRKKLRWNLFFVAKPCRLFSRKHGERFFRWFHLSCSHESHYKVSLQGIIIIKSTQGVIARSHCKESLQGVIARSHCKESLQGVIARSHESHCELRMESSGSRKCKESSASCKCKESGASCKCMESSASCKCKESSASCKCKESSAIDLRGVKISS